MKSISLVFPSESRAIQSVKSRTITQKACYRAHGAFDSLWRNWAMSRSLAYALLAKELGLKPEECHIGMFEEDACVKTERIARSLELK